ncbi:PilC/PilY family type IV pilus protein [Psychrobacter sp. Arc29]|uniref:hypothetical protein n=1 Tax=Psychrobacter sp. Arc29 TaxID=3046690 RepID=UPI00352F9F58
MILKKLIPNQLRYSKLSQSVKPLCYAVALSMIALPVNAGKNDLGDLEIYKAAESGGAVLTLMLDTSGSMGTVDFGTESRLTILKRALTELLTKKDANGNYTLSSNNIIGLGQYSVDKDGNGSVDGKAGSILVPARKLDEVQRTKLIATLTGFRASGNTPAANAYAEAGAYMMGTTTTELKEGEEALKVLGRIVRGDYSNYYKAYPYYIQRCASGNSSTISPYKGAKFYFCNNSQFETVATEYHSSWNKIDKYLDVARDEISSKIDNFYEDSSTIGYYSEMVGGDEEIKDTEESGYTVSTQEAKDATNNYLNYNAPVSDSQCSGYGIYFLTDGVPNGSSNSIASGLMNLSLKGNSSSLSLDGSCAGGLNNVNNSTGWACMGEYAKKLRDVTNPAKRSILTATVGFGREFAGIKTSVDGAGKTVYHCDETDTNSSITPSAHVKNLCKLGSEAYGGGGFYYTTDADSLAASVSSFTAKLTQIIETAPSGTITIPNDPLSSTNLQPFAYLPMLEPKVAGAQYVWPGNLKKYNVYQGTLYGKSSFPFAESNRLYVDDDGDDFPDDLNNNTQDVWSTTDYKNDKGISANNSIYAGGAYARLKAPTVGTNASTTRNVYVESGTGSNAKLVNIKVTNGTIVGFDQLDSDYGIREKLYLLSFLGYNVPTDAVTIISALGTAASQTTALNNIVKTPPTQEVRVLGGVVHSKPKQVSYGAEFTTEGEISNDEKDRDDYIMFGSMDGALHLVSAEKGEETFAFIPKTIIKQQLKALKADSEGSVGTTVFGVDAPWTSSSVLEYDFSGTPKKVKATSVRAYGGLRMGGKGVYGLDLTTKDKPTFLFSKNTTDTGFSRLGQVWSEPTVAKIRVKKGSGFESKEVVIVSGGYDMCYENPSFKLKNSGDNTSCEKKTQAEGNAVYILDASDGSIISSISGSDSGTNHTKVTSMKHSIVGGVTALDRDDDGNIDHLYYADLGGSVYRADLNSGATNASLVKRVVRVLDASSGQTLPYRFYERPIVSFYTSPYQEIFASVTVASGDRSTPLSMLRDTDNPNYLFNVFDYDIAQPSIFSYADTSLTTVDKKINDLVSLPFNQNNALKNLTNRKTVLETIAKGAYDDTKKRYIYDYAGWRYPLSYFDGYSGVEGVKSVGEPLVYGSRLYTTAYSPEMVYDQADNCSARVVGGSERQIYCMPYGICEDTESLDGTAGYTRAGKGIQELTLGAYSKDQRNVKLLIGPQSLADQVKIANRNNSNTGSGGLNQTTEAGLQVTNNTVVNDGTSGYGGKSDSVVETNGRQTADSNLGSEKYKFIPKRWYELYEEDE